MILVAFTDLIKKTDFKIKCQAEKVVYREYIHAIYSQFYSLKLLFVNELLPVCSRFLLTLYCPH